MDSEKKRDLPPPEAHPEKPLIEGKPAPTERLMRHMQDSPKTRRGVLVGAAAIAGLGLALGINKFAHGQSEPGTATPETKNVLTEPHLIHAKLDDDMTSLEFSDVAEYWKAIFKFAQVNGGPGLFTPKFREFTTDEAFQKEDNPYIEAEPSNLPDDVQVELMLSKRYNDLGLASALPASISDPKDADQTWYLWGILKDSLGNPIDPKGESVSGKVYATSPIFFNLTNKVKE